MGFLFEAYYFSGPFTLTPSLCCLRQVNWESSFPVSDIYSSCELEIFCLYLETWEVAMSKELAPWPSILQISKVCALQNDLGAASCYKPVDPLRAGMHENILHRVGGFYFQG